MHETCRQKEWFKICNNANEQPRIFLLTPSDALEVDDFTRIKKNLLESDNKTIYFMIIWASGESPTQYL